MPWDYSKSAGVYYYPDKPNEYTIRHHESGKEWVFPTTVYPNAVMKKLGYELAPEWLPEGAGIQERLL